MQSAGPEGRGRISCVTLAYYDVVKRPVSCGVITNRRHNCIRIVKGKEGKCLRVLDSCPKEELASLGVAQSPALVTYVDTCYKINDGTHVYDETPQAMICPRGHFTRAGVWCIFIVRLI